MNMNSVEVNNVECNKQTNTNKRKEKKFTFSVEPGFFVQSCPDYEKFSDTRYIYRKIPHLEPRFGLNANYSWNKFVHLINSLIENKHDTEFYKVVFFARHGEGFHNLCQMKYGSKSCWMKTNGDDEMIWGPDAFLSPAGIQQVKQNNLAWKNEIIRGAPIPTSFYSSSLTRAADTLCYTWEGIISKNISPIFVENLREMNGVHTCNKRRSKSYLKKRYPFFKFETGFTEEDQLWCEYKRESHAQLDERAQEFLQNLFKNDKSIYVVVSTHSGTINAFLRALNHPPYNTPTAGIIPVVIKATLI